MMKLLLNATRAIPAALFLGLQVTTAAAQATPDTATMLPRELVEALVQPYGGGSNNTEFFVGKVAPALQPFLFVPTGARIIGSMASPSSTTVVMSAPLNPIEITTQYEREQPKLGWTRPPAVNAMRGWGFGPPPSATPEGAGQEFCHVGQSLRVVPFPNAAGSTRIIVTVQNFGGRCQMSNRVVFVGGQQPRIALPALENPLGAPMNSVSCSRVSAIGSSTSSMTERLETPMTAAQLLDHFGKQLADSGWTAAPQLSPMLRRTWTRADSGNTVREATLQIAPLQGTAPGATCEEIALSVRQVPARRAP
jgi:hypothetical protein